MSHTRRRLGAVSSLILVMILSVSILTGNEACVGFIRSTQTRLPSILSTQYTNRGPITITSDSGFLSAGFTGIGNESHPYILDGVSISDYEECISISDTTAHFVIRDCLFTGTGGTGIKFHSVQNGSVESCLISNKWRGIDFDSCTDCSLNDITISNGDFGVYITSSTGCRVENSVIHGQRVALDLHSSTGLIISENEVYHSERGVEIGSCTALTVTNNDLTNSGFQVSGPNTSYWNHTFAGNVVNGRPLGYFADVTDTTLDASSYGQLLLGHCTNVTATSGVFRDIDYGVVMQ
ncbi:MAG: right-handed parallel beta-helix repeat-containing protein [Candidatus Thorarchaeota archaeon]|nr:MAG: right-handed parallel beta-helix repeat-containing protein [Candidatus Thorarchaeota archaeon]